MTCPLCHRRYTSPGVLPCEKCGVEKVGLAVTRPSERIAFPIITALIIALLILC